MPCRVTQGRTHKVTTMISRSNSYLRRSIIISRCRSSSYLGSVPFMASDGAEDPMNVFLLWSGHNIRPWGLLLFTIFKLVFRQNYFIAYVWSAKIYVNWLNIFISNRWNIFCHTVSLLLIRRFWQVTHVKQSS